MNIERKKKTIGKNISTIKNRNDMLHVILFLMLCRILQKEQSKEF